MVQNGLATVLLALLLILSLPLIVQLWLLGNLSASLSLLLLLGPALAMGMISFRVHRVLEPAFSDTFTDDSVSPEPHPADGLEHTGSTYSADSIDVDSPVPQPGPQQSTGQSALTSHRSLDDPLVVAAMEHLEEQDELWQLLEERIARMHETGDAPPQSGLPGSPRDGD